MPLNWTEEEWRAYCRQKGIACEGAGGKPSKYRNKRTEYNGRNYDSRREADRAAELQMLVKAGELAGVLEQVAFPLPGGIQYRADFVLLNWDHTFTIEDAKGVRTKEYILKKKLMAQRGLEIVEV